MLRTLVFGLCCFLFAGICSAQTQTPFDGDWTAVVSDDEKLRFTLTTGEGGKLTGMVAREGAGKTPIEWGFVKGDLIVFKVLRDFQGTPRPFVYVGRVQGDQIAFGRRPEDLSLGRLREVTATRVK